MTDRSDFCLLPLNQALDASDMGCTPVRLRVPQYLGRAEAGTRTAGQQNSEAPE
jgi:hypothetical protein